MEARLAAAQREIANLRSRIVSLEEENTAMRAKLFESTGESDCSQEINLPANKKQRCHNDEAPMAGMSTRAKFKEFCDFCNPL